MSSFSLLGGVGKGLLSAGKGVGKAAQYATMGTDIKSLRGAMKRPIRAGGMDNPATRQNLQKIGLAGQGLGFLTLPFLANKLTERLTLNPEEDAYARQDLLAQRRAVAQAKLALIEKNKRKLEIESYEKKLQDVAPDLYNRIAAGRYLPAGAVVIGGVPRRDLIRELAESMHEGAFTPPPTGEVNISDLLA